MPEDEKEKPDGPSYDEKTGSFGYERGKPFPWWAALMLPFLAVFWLLYRAARERVNWKAAWGAVFVFEAVLTTAETFSVARGHWVYNRARILGPAIFGVPIEEHLLYYLFAPLVVICSMHALRMGLERREAR